MSIRFLADENFNRAIIDGVLRYAPEADVVRVQDLDLRTVDDDPTILEWAAREGRVLLSHDAGLRSPPCRRRSADGRRVHRFGVIADRDGHR